MATVRLSRVLAPVVADRLTVDIPGEDLGAVVDGLLARIPELRIHLFDAAGALRPHVLCVVDGEAVRDLDRASPVATVEFLHAVSGG